MCTKKWITCLQRSGKTFISKVLILKKSWAHFDTTSIFCLTIQFSFSQNEEQYETDEECTKPEEPPSASKGQVPIFKNVVKI